MQPSRIFDLSVYFIADPSLCAGRDVTEVVRAAVSGGITMLQFRDKSEGGAQNAALCRDIQAVLAPYKVPLIINDYVDLALAVGADGVHLGQGDMPPESARKLLGPDKIIGVTAFTEEQVSAIDPEIVDYIGTGPFYETQTKKGKLVLGAENFARLVKLSPVPVVGIGGITPDNACGVIKAGADGVAMMRSISEADDPESAARAFTEGVKIKR